MVELMYKTLVLDTLYTGPRPAHEQLQVAGTTGL